MDAPNTAFEIEYQPMCDICKYRDRKMDSPASYDGKTTNGPWAFMCEPHFEKFGVGLGLGRGQKLIIKLPSKGSENV